MSAEEDKVIAEYDVYITPEQAEQLYLLQYPNRSRDLPYNEKHGMQPLEMRLKSASGFLEIDVPVDVGPGFDKTKGVTWGEALFKAKEQGQTTFGMASGLERAPVPRGAARSSANNAGEASYEIIDERVRNFDETYEKGLVLNKQTLGGEIERGEASDKPMYMLGAFTKNQLHLTRLNGVVAMRPQFSHVDAAAYIEQTNRKREGNEGAKPAEPRAVQMSLKTSNSDGTSTEQKTIRDHLRAARDESWLRLEYHDEEAEEAYKLYGNRVFVEDAEGAAQLLASMNNLEYLEAVSVPRMEAGTKKKPAPRKEPIALDDSDSDVPKEKAKRVRFEEKKSNGEVMEIDD